MGLKGSKSIVMRRSFPSSVMIVPQYITFFVCVYAMPCRAVSAAHHPKLHNCPPSF